MRGDPTVPGIRLNSSATTCSLLAKTLDLEPIVENLHDRERGFVPHINHAFEGDRLRDLWIRGWRVNNPPQMEATAAALDAP
jgi:hypothetical protein